VKGKGVEEATLEPTNAGHSRCPINAAETEEVESTENQMDK